MFSVLSLIYLSHSSDSSLQAVRKEILRSSPKKKGQPTGGIEPPTFRLQSECSTTKLSRRTTPQIYYVFPQVKRLRGPGIEPGSTAWKATMLTITPATPDNGGGEQCSRLTCLQAKMFSLHPARFELARTMSTGA